MEDIKQIYKLAIKKIILNNKSTVFCPFTFTNFHLQFQSFLISFHHSFSLTQIKVLLIINLSCLSYSIIKCIYYKLFYSCNKMQSNYFISQQPIPIQKINQLNRKLRKWQIIALSLFILILALSLSIFISCYRQNLTSIATSNQVVSYLETCSKIQLNNTNLKNFRWKMQFAQTDNYKNQELQGQTVRIVSLDLSNNQIQQFSNNILPDLQSLNLSRCRQRLRIFSNNNFPKLNQSTSQFSFFNLDRFQNNSLPMVKFIQYGVIFTDNFEYNYMPSFTGEKQFFGFKTLIGNTLGVNSLRLYADETHFQLYGNTFSKLKSLVLFCGLNSKYPIISKQFSSNKFPVLKSLAVVCNITEFYSNNFQQIQQLELDRTSFKEFKNYSFKQLRSLRLQSSQIHNFTNNKLPKLTFLQLQSTELINMCQGNQMPNLAELQIENSDSKIDLNCLKNSKTLQSISGQLNGSIQNFILPSLKNFSLIFKQASQPFSNNSFPSLQKLQISNVNFTSLNSSNISLGSSLKVLYLSDSSIKDLSFDRAMPNLKLILVQRSHMQTVDCSTFKNINQLFLVQGRLKDSVVDVLISCNFTQVTQIFLDDNLIADKNKAKAKLSLKYPTAYISL